MLVRELPGFIRPYDAITNQITGKRVHGVFLVKVTTHSFVLSGVSVTLVAKSGTTLIG